MTEVEMLELAAKAARVPKRIVGAEPGTYALYPETDGVDKFRLEKQWNPRTDDGDSRRLQMNLGISLRVMDSFLLASKRLCDGTWIEAREDFNACGDACDSARLAVLRCAAEIGRAMP